ncbi:MAG TPA: hypothetical protein VIN93_02150 [Bryobacteraceae bacterium]|jgi:hypothetical protein
MRGKPEAERTKGIITELAEVETFPELMAIWHFGQLEQNEYASMEFRPLFQQAAERLTRQSSHELNEQSACAEA